MIRASTRLPSPRLAAFSVPSTHPGPAPEVGAGVRRDLRTSLADAAAYSLMVGLGESYLPAYALALGMADVVAGLVATLPMLAGAILQLISPWAVKRLGSHRTWVVACAVCQAASLLVLPLAVPLGARAGWLVFAAASVYWGAGLATAPAWNTWIESLVPRQVRTAFFAQRVRIGQVCTLTGFAVAGITLQAGKLGGWTLLAFIGLFCVAATCRLLSARCLSTQQEPLRQPEEKENAFSLREAAGRFLGHASGRLLVYLFAVQIAVQIAGPYFTPFMLSQLQLTYFQYMVLIGTAFLSKVISLNWLGRFAHRFGARRLLTLGGLGIVPMSGLWFFSDSFSYLIVIQILSGAAWAAYELAMFLMFFETIDKRERTSLLTLYNLGNAAAMGIGAGCGALLLGWLGSNHEAYLVVFAISSLARIGTLLLLDGVPPLTRTPAEAATFSGTIAVRPWAGGVDRPILADSATEPGVLQAEPECKTMFRRSGDPSPEPSTSTSA